MADSNTPSVLLVHGAFADASGWAGVITELVASGLDVIAPPNPLRGPYDKIYISSIAEQVAGPVLLVAHSYGGVVISAQQPDNVVGLVYVNSFAPDEGETLLDINGRFPDTLSGPALRTQTFPVEGGDPGTEFFLDFDLFHAAFCADVSDELAAVMARAQRPAAIEGFTTPAGPPSWKSLPSWAAIGTSDQTIHVDALHFMAERAGSKVTEIAGASHVGFIPNPKPYAEMIRKAVGSL
jgi:pimeloyl-ACP methyl ester carboxylesterase